MESVDVSVNSFLSESLLPYLSFSPQSNMYKYGGHIRKIKLNWTYATNSNLLTKRDWGYEQVHCEVKLKLVFLCDKMNTSAVTFKLLSGKKVSRKVFKHHGPHPWHHDHDHEHWPDKSPHDYLCFLLPLLFIAESCGSLHQCGRPPLVLETPEQNWEQNRRERGRKK